MSDHYYSSQPQSASQEQRMTFQARGVQLQLYTDRGVFAKGNVDFGSALLIDHVTVGETATMLDMGCGYGVIGLTFAKEFPARHVTLADVNERAIALAQKNAVHNAIHNIEIIQSNLFQHITQHSFDVIVTNPPIRAGKAVVHRIFEESYEYLVPGGSLWIVIQKKQGAPSAMKKLAERFDVDEITKHKGYRIIRAKKEI